MENYDPRRRQGGDDESRRYPPHDEERGRDRDSLRPDDDRSRRQEQRYGQSGSERSNFSPDWSREGAEPRYSDDPYYSRNRDPGRQDYSGDQSREWRGDDERSRREQRRGRDVQRSRDDEQGHYRGYYSRSTTPFAYPGGEGYLYSESITLHGPYSGRGPKGYRRSDQ